MEWPAWRRKGTGASQSGNEIPWLGPAQCGRGLAALAARAGLFSLDWQAQNERFSERYRVVAIDLRGHGQSMQEGPLTCPPWRRMWPAGSTNSPSLPG